MLALEDQYVAVLSSESQRDAVRWEGCVIGLLEDTWPSLVKAPSSVEVRSSVTDQAEAVQSVEDRAEAVQSTEDQAEAVQSTLEGQLKSSAGGHKVKEHTGLLGEGALAAQALARRHSRGAAVVCYLDRPVGEAWRRPGIGQAAE